MHFDSNSPIWLQVMTVLQMDIMTDKAAPGSKLPGGRDLALTYGINPNTAARVYQELEKTGLCVTRRGMGTYVTEDTQLISSFRRMTAQQAIRQCLSTLDTLGISREEAIQMMIEEEEHPC